MLFSKRPELFLPDHWPTYYSKAKGTYVDLENKKYLDMICTLDLTFLVIQIMK